MGMDQGQPKQQGKPTEQSNDQRNDPNNLSQFIRRRFATLA